MTEIEMKEKGLIKRLTNRTFKIDKERILGGHYVAKYFLKTREIVEKYYKDTIVTMQFFCRHNDVKVCGIDEVISLIYEVATNPNDLIIEALDDGDIINENEIVLRITGHYTSFGFLEGMIDGILARNTSICTNAYKITKIIDPNRVFFMGDRDDLYLNQQRDGYAVYINGIKTQCTDAMLEYPDLISGGTMPHALIAIANGDIIEATEKYHLTFSNELVSALVDFHNNVVEESIKVLEKYKDKLVSVRVDTSKSLIDYSLSDLGDKKELYGVNSEQIKRLRVALDKHGGKHVKIIVSSGFDVDRIKEMEDANAPVDFYGIGSSILKLKIGFTGDVVRVNGKDLAKVGRKYLENPRLKRVIFNEINE